MRNPMVEILRGLLSHSVFLGFLGFAVVAVVAREALFGMVDAPSVETSEETVIVDEPEFSVGQGLPTHTLPVESLPERVVDASGTESVAPPSAKRAEAEVAVSAAPVLRADTVTPGLLPPQVKVADADQMLQKARRAFWDGALDQAQHYYLGYLEHYPADANVFGELGNLYQSMGRPTDALDAYYEAGLRFKARGEQEELRQIAELFKEAGDARFDKLKP